MCVKLLNRSKPAVHDLRLNTGTLGSVNDFLQQEAHMQIVSLCRRMAYIVQHVSEGAGETFLKNVVQRRARYR